MGEGDEEALPVCREEVSNAVVAPEAGTEKEPAVPESDTSKEACSSVDCSSLVVVILVGVPGSGKSRFCHKVIENAAQTWIRICQDVIANGKRGTKAQCIKEASSALSSSRSIFIDRTNLTKEQRLDFIQFAKNSKVDCHAVVLSLPVGTCITRAMNRTSHEGGLEGKKVGAVIQKMAQGVEIPTLDDGFSRIMICKTDGDVDNAIGTYAQLNSSAKLPPGVFGSILTSSTKGSLQQFFKPVQSQGGEGGSGTSRKVDAKPKLEANASAVPELRSVAVEPQRTDGDGKGAKVSEDGWKALAFPSISTADFRFDHEIAAKVIVETVSEFLSRDENAVLRLVMVDIDATSDMLTRVRSLAESAGLDRQRFLTVCGDITRLHSTGGLKCFAIANAANWRLKGGGGGVNLAIYKAAGHGFEEATKQCAKTLDPGKVVAVPLPSSSPLRSEGVTHVIHVLGPNMNPQRPNCIANNLTEGIRLLRAAYSSLFSTFASLAKGRAVHTARAEAGATGNRGDGTAAAPRDAFAVLMKRKTGNDDTDTSLKRGRVGTSVDVVQNIAETSTEGAKAEAEAGSSARKTTKWPGWAQALYNTAFHPEKHRDVILEVTDEAVVLPDLFAKAKKHLLVVARVEGLDTIADVRKEHLPLLHQLHAIGERWARKFMEEDPSLVFRLGYHWAPSMRQLHLHVISQDFDSPGLKNKKHWNSFTTSFFRDSTDVILELETSGAIKQCSDETERSLLDSELRCHRCRCVQPNIPRLKTHISSCQKALQAGNAVVSP